MDAENNSADSEDPNWAYPLLRMVLTGAFIEIIATTILWVLSGIGFVPMPLMPVVDFFVAGAFLTGSWAIGFFSVVFTDSPSAHQRSRSVDASMCGVSDSPTITQKLRILGEF